MWVNRGFVALCGRLEISGSLPAELRDGSILLAANHIGVFDAFVLTRRATGPASRPGS